MTTCETSKSNISSPVDQQNICQETSNRTGTNYEDQCSSTVQRQSTSRNQKAASSKIITGNVVGGAIIKMLSQNTSSSSKFSTSGSALMKQQNKYWKIVGIQTSTKSPHHVQYVLLVGKRNWMPTFSTKLIENHWLPNGQADYQIQQLLFN